MSQCDQFDNLYSLLIDLQYLIADIVNELRVSTTTRAEIDPNIYYEACMVDIATRGLILSIQSVLFDMASDEGCIRPPFGPIQ